MIVNRPQIFKSETAFSHRTEAAGSTLNAAYTNLITAGYASPGDGGGALYKRVTPEPSHAGKFQSADGVGWWEIVPQGGLLPVKAFGALGDDSTDDTTAIQNCLTAANSMNAAAFFNKGTYRISSVLVPSAGLVIKGAGRSSVIKQTNSSNPQVFKCTSVNNVHVEKVKLTAHDSGSDRNTVYLTTCQNWRFLDIWIEDQTDSNGIFMIDCDDCVVDRLYFDGGASLNGYAGYIGGGKGCKFVNCTAYRPEFGFVIVGKSIQPLSVRDDEEAFGNLFHGCRVHGHSGHAYDLNSVYGNIVSNCVAENYAGASTNIAFQVKAQATDNARQNVFIGCTARDVPNGFGGQTAANAVFIGCTALETSGAGFLFNALRRSQIQNCIVRNFGTAAVQMLTGSSNNVIDGLLIDTDEATATGILIADSGGSSNQFDHVQIVSTLANAIDIGTSCNNNRFGWNFNANQMPIVDDTGTSIWPVIFTTTEIDVSGTGNVHGPLAVRGMQVARARFVITTSIVGTPQGQCGRIGSNQTIAAAQALSGAASASVSLTLAASPSLTTAGVLQGRIGTAGTSGAGFFQVEGLPLL